MFKAMLTGTLCACLMCLTLTAKANDSKLTVEELRLTKATQQMAEVVSRLQSRVDTFHAQLQQATNYTTLMQLILRHGKALWQDAVTDFATANHYDDRSLYWARLAMTAALRQAPEFQRLLADQQDKLLWQFELLSRGLNDVRFDRHAKLKVLLTGFDPFFLDRHIEQSNPSGVVALALDDLSMNIDGISVEVETLIVPVRFADFDRGIVEQMLSPLMQSHQVDMVLTVSMGREGFDLERFPALRRSAKAPDNLNVYTGATEQKPLLPTLGAQPLSGPEFLEFSLPAQAMVRVNGPYAVHDNRQVTTTVKTFAPKQLAELSGAVSVKGSGGGYLSNEVSYRSLLLREQLAPGMPVGHIHVPRVMAFDRDKNRAIVAEFKAILTQAVLAHSAS